MKFLNQKRMTFLAVLIFSSVIAASNANATLKLKLSSGSSFTEFVDLDADGVVSTGQMTQGAFAVNVTTGVSYPLIGSQLYPALDLNSVNVSGGAGKITLELTGTDFMSFDPMYLLTSIGGTTQGTVTWETYADASNAEYGRANLIASGSSSGPAFSASQNFIFNPGGTFSLTHVVTITHNSMGISSLDLITEVPEPAPLALIGLGLTFIRIRRERRRLV